jgi:hypothetical protein
VQQFIDANHSPAEVVIIHGVSPHVAPVASSAATGGALPLYAPWSW